MKGKIGKAEKEMSKASLATLVQFYTGDMQRRNLRPDSVEGSRRALIRFARWLPNGPETRLLDITEDRARAYLEHLQTRTARYEHHHYKHVEEGPLSPFTIRRQIKELKVFGNWPKRQGFMDPFEQLMLPKTPKRTVDILSDQELAQMMTVINPQTAVGGRMYAMISLMLDSGLRVSEIAAAKMADLDLERRQLKVSSDPVQDATLLFRNRLERAPFRYANPVS